MPPTQNPDLIQNLDKNGDDNSQVTTNPADPADPGLSRPTPAEAGDVQDRSRKIEEMSQRQKEMEKENKKKKELLLKAIAERYLLSGNNINFRQLCFPC